jgi:hypothetical protein
MLVLNRLEFMLLPQKMGGSGTGAARNGRFFTAPLVFRHSDLQSYIL